MTEDTYTIKDLLKIHTQDDLVLKRLASLFDFDSASKVMPSNAKDWLPSIKMTEWKNWKNTSSFPNLYEEGFSFQHFVYQEDIHGYLIKVLVSCSFSMENQIPPTDKFFLGVSKVKVLYKQPGDIWEEEMPECFKVLI